MASAVVFDLDDTLYLESDFVRSGFHSVGEWCRKELSLEGFEAASWKLFEEGRRGDIFDRALALLGGPTGKDLSVIARMVAVYRNHPPRIALPADAVQCLTQLRGKYKLGLITDGPAEMQWNKIRALGLKDILDEIIVTADLGSGFSKPHPLAFEEMESRFRMPGGRMVYVADNPAKDFAAPGKRGWQTIRVLREESLHRKAADTLAADFILPDLRGVADIIGL